ncbi:MAG: phytoene desaturase [Bacteroidetes bacterium]|nr:phytoene desaturase [Bacteroidota bacterium]
MKIGIIGAGIAGLACAIRLSVKGYEVEVFESNDYPGGKLSEFELNGFRFDAGPSLFTMPQYFEELFSMAGRQFSDYCTYEKLSITTQYFYPDGSAFKAYADQKLFLQEATKCWEIEAKKIETVLKNSANIYALTAEVFMENSLHKWPNYKLKLLAKAGIGFRKLGLFSTMHSYNSKKLNNKKAEQYFDRFATYNGSNPYLAPATLNIIPHLEHGIGAFFPHGGMISLTNALFKFSKELGVQFRFEEKVEEIIITKNKIKGLRTSKNDYSFDKVVSNMDIFYTYNLLLPNEKKPKQILKQERSSSALIFYWGMNKVFENLQLHNIFFTENYEKEFNALFKEQKIDNDPTIYINITSKYEKNDAPKGGENWFVMVNAPNNDWQNWDELVSNCRKNLIVKLEKMLQTSIESHIVCESTLDPRSIELKTASYKGALYGSSSNSKFSAFLRHKNYSSSIDNLYFCGGSVHPGGGIPLCLQSAKIVSDLIPTNKLRK